MKVKRLVILVIFSAFVTVLVGCEAAGQPKTFSVQISPELKGKSHLTLAVLPFERGEPKADREDEWASIIEIKDAGNAVSDMFTSELMRVPGFKLVERSQLKKILNELDLSLSDLIAERSAGEIGKLLGVDAIVLGHVAECLYGTSWIGQRWHSFSYSIRIVQAESGTVLASAYVAQRGEDTSDVMGRCHQSVRAVVDEIIEKRAKK